MENLILVNAGEGGKTKILKQHPSYTSPGPSKMDSRSYTEYHGHRLCVSKQHSGLEAMEWGLQKRKVSSNAKLLL